MLKKKYELSKKTSTNNTNDSSSALFSKIRYYLKVRKDILSQLSKTPNNWQKYQELFNKTVEQISLDILQLERYALDKSIQDADRLKKIFGKRYRKYFLYGEYPIRSYQKPFGYAGDFQIMDDIYKNKPCTAGFDGLWDYYFQQMTAPIAIRQRKEDIKDEILKVIKNTDGKDIRLMSLGCGPAREIKELLEEQPANLFSNVIFDCYDFDERAVTYAKNQLNGIGKVNFYKKNALRLALRKNIKIEIPWNYDFIYSAGLFDYLEEKIAARLLSNLKNLIKPHGRILVSNFGDKYSNTSAGLMEWATEWYLIYRTVDELRTMFISAGFSDKDLNILSQNNNVIHYCFAANS